MTFKDKTFCASPDCKNECGRKMTPEDVRELEVAAKVNIWNGVISQAYFCGVPDEIPSPSVA